MLLRRITEHVKAQNWTAVGLDFVIVVVGVFVGIQVANWNDVRQDEVRAQEYLVRIQRDILADVVRLDERITYWRDIGENGEAALLYLETGVLKDGSNWKSLLAFFHASQYWTFSTKDTTYRELVSAGELRLIRDSELRTTIANYYIESERRAQILYAFRPAYREALRSLTPLAIQEYYWANCHTDDRQGAVARLQLIECDAPKFDTNAAQILNQFAARPDLSEKLRFWTARLSQNARVAATDRADAEILAARIADAL